MLTGSSSYSGATTISQGELVVDGCLSNSAVTVTGGTLGGTGYVGNVTVNGGGQIATGGSLGVLHVSGDLVLTASAAVNCELDASASGIGQLDVSGQATLNGALDVKFASGFTPSAGQSFDLITGATTGNFSQVNLPPLANGMSWNTGSLYATGTISVVPEPSTLALLGFGAGGLLCGGFQRRRAARIVRDRSR